MANIISLGFTGTQAGMTLEQKKAFLLELEFLRSFNLGSDIEFHHCDCIGSDEEADGIVRIFLPRPWLIVIHPPLDESKRAFCKGDSTAILEAKEYLERDEDMVKEIQVLIATPSREEYQRSGTWATIRMARKQKKPHNVIMPNGSIRRTTYA
jgi:hypothetical protein